MVMQALGVETLVRLMRLERAAEADTSWLLHGPAEAPAEREEDPPVWRFAAE